MDDPVAYANVDTCYGLYYTDPNTFFKGVDS